MPNLVLSRRINENTRIKVPLEAMLAAVEKGEDIDITCSVINANGNRVRLAFEAPREVIIHREEVMRKINDTTESCATAPGGSSLRQFLQNRPASLSEQGEDQD